MFDILRPFLFKINPETAHSLAINALKFGNIASTKINKSPTVSYTHLTLPTSVTV